MRSTAPERLGSDLQKSRFSEGDACETGSSSKRSGGAFRRRNFINTVFTAIRYSQVEKAESPRKEFTLRNTCRNASWVRSSASATSFVICKHTEYTRFLCNWKRVANASWSPCFAR